MEVAGVDGSAATVSKKRPKGAPEERLSLSPFILGDLLECFCFPDICRQDIFAQMPSLDAQNNSQRAHICPIIFILDHMMVKLLCQKFRLQSVRTRPKAELNKQYKIARMVKQESGRFLQANNRELNTLYGYPNNAIKTSKYNVFNFLPLNLFEQFQRLANAYFLILLFLQLIPEISALAWYTTVIPLVMVLSITGVKDAIDDLKRHQSDHQVNNRSVLLLVNGRIEEEKWKNIQVGDIIKLKNNEQVTADLLLLSSSEPFSLTYIETTELDGETNLKVKQAISVTSDMKDNLELLSAFDGEVKCEPPNNKLDKFSGILTYKGEKYFLDQDKLLLRGCVIKNTDWCCGLVIYTGPDTKLMQNSGKSTFKRTYIDHLLNVLVIWIFLLLSAMCCILAIGHGIWQYNKGYYFQIFLPWDDYVSSSFLSATLIFWSYFIVLNTMVPISLYVSIEIIRLGNSYYINWDRKMFYAPKNTPAQARTTTLNDGLGQVQYVFSDKTGTLTQNIMIFSKCSINGKRYGYCHDRNGQSMPVCEEDKVDFSYNELADPKFSFYDKTLVEAVKSGDHWVHLFFLTLSLCHTVISEEKVEGMLVYQAQSPDEGALVTAARNFGFVFRSRTSETITIVEMGETKVYQLLAILDFSNVRKRMSLLGATAIEDKLQDEVPETISTLNKAKIKIWVLTGDKQETAVNIAYSCNIFKDEMDEVFIVEGKNSETIQKELRSARNKMKPESLLESDPINILLTKEPKTPFKIPEEKPNSNYGLVINGYSLAYALEGDLELELLRTACMCKGVVCCRMTPLQKAQVVELVKKYKTVVTLAIGDGANDVSMIKAAHIGVAITSQEGLQAMLSSDFAFSQFHYLRRLLLVHGRWSYNRMCKFLNYFFYKNFTFTLVHFWYAFYNGFSAQTVFDIWFIACYNLIYTSLPVLCMSLLDQDVNETWSLHFPELYEPGQHNLYFNKKEFMKCLMHGIYSSFVLFFIPMGTIYNTERKDGKDISDYQSFSLIVQTSLICVVTIQIAVKITYWTMIIHFFVWGSLSVYFCILFFLYSDGLCLMFPSIFHFLGVARNTLYQPQMWLCVILCVTFCIIPVIGYKFLRPLLWPLSVDKVYGKIRHFMKHPLPPPIRVRMKRSSLRRSAYAFSHKSGFGALITSGKTEKFNRNFSAAPHFLPIPPWRPGGERVPRFIGASRPPPRKGASKITQARVPTTPPPRAHPAARDSGRPRRRGSVERGKGGRDRGRRGRNQRAVRRGGSRTAESGPSASRPQGGPGVTNRSGKEGGAGARRRPRDPGRTRNAAANAANAAARAEGRGCGESEALRQPTDPVLAHLPALGPAPIGATLPARSRQTLGRAGLSPTGRSDPEHRPALRGPLPIRPLWSPPTVLSRPPPPYDRSAPRSHPGSQIRDRPAAARAGVPEAATAAGPRHRR
ncbi:PREDICTED: phospholipid-transporting ATPase FetA-like [Dipodomys ordii]|uniref:Phospholipid-transporting ATPase n=1 Tax=Dipodomys ordii TaxID=10020 RepID=A0A1S3G154_DIPOR|nr:PREDICTED: phospholipid-transporting ATPase FetA-like [Dipodomys ordii]